MGYDISADHHGPLPRKTSDTGINEEGHRTMIEKENAERQPINDTTAIEYNIKMMLNELARQCYKNAKDHGFWQPEDDLIRIVKQYGDNLGQPSGQVRNDLLKLVFSLFDSQKVALEMSELAERLETLRKDPNKMDEHCPEFLNLEIEVADLIIRAMDFSGRRNLRIGEAVLAKMKYNASRPFMHGKKF